MRKNVAARQRRVNEQCLKPKVSVNGTVSAARETGRTREGQRTFQVPQIALLRHHFSLALDVRYAPFFLVL